MAASSPHHMPNNVKTILLQFPQLSFQKDTQKIKCSLTGHEMPCSAAAINSYVQGKKFQRLQKEAEYDYKQLEPHIVPSTKKNQEHKLFCLLTLRHIVRTPSSVDAHLKGRRYRKELARWKQCQESGEKFRPLCAQKRKRETDIDLDEDNTNDEEGNQSSEDSYSDLYPSAHFGEPESGDPEMSGSDFDVDAMEESTSQESLHKTKTKKSKISVENNDQKPKTKRNKSRKLKYK